VIQNLLKENKHTKEIVSLTYDTKIVNEGSCWLLEIQLVTVFFLIKEGNGIFQVTERKFPMSQIFHENVIGNYQFTSHNFFP